VYFTAPDAAAAVDPHDWDILVSAARPRAEMDPEGRGVDVQDTVLRACRREEGQVQWPAAMPQRARVSITSRHHRS
jgi:hypothetical protein